MRLLFIALLCALSYAQTGGFSERPILRQSKWMRRILEQNEGFPHRVISPRTETYSEVNGVPMNGGPIDDDDSDESIDFSEYYDETIVALISVATAITICFLMMMCMYVSHLQHASDIDLIGKPQRRYCCCCLVKPKKPREVYGTFDPTFPVDFIDVKLPAHMQDGDSQHVIFMNDPDMFNRDSSEENEGYLIDSTPNYDDAKVK